MKAIYFTLLWVIAVISCVDVYWAIQIGDKLIDVELNPLGVYLMEIGGLGLFMSVKMFGTILSLSILYWLYKQRPKMAWCVIIPVALLQISLFYYLFDINTEDQTPTSTNLIEDKNYIHTALNKQGD